MTPSALLAEKVRETTATRTDYATARALGVSQSYLKQVLLGHRNFGPEACVRAAELLKQPVTAVLAEIELSKATTPEKQAFWRERLPRVLPALVVWGLAAGVTYVSVKPCTASNYLRDSLYIMRRRWLSIQGSATSSCA